MLRRVAGEGGANDVEFGSPVWLRLSLAASTPIAILLRIPACACAEKRACPSGDPPAYAAGRVSEQRVCGLTGDQDQPTRYATAC